MRRLEFQDGTCWVVRLQLKQYSPDAAECLQCEVHTMTTVRKRSTIPVPEVYAYEPTHDNVVGVPFILMEFIPGNTAMDSFGGTRYIGGKLPRSSSSNSMPRWPIFRCRCRQFAFPRLGPLPRLRMEPIRWDRSPGSGAPLIRRHSSLTRRLLRLHFLTVMSSFVKELLFRWLMKS